MRYGKSNNRAPSFSIMHVALLLLCAVIITSHVTGGLYAKYMTKSEGDDSAKVIRFGDIYLEESPNNNLMLIPGVVGKKEAYINFEGSEAATYVFVVIEASSHWTCSGNTIAMYDQSKRDMLVSLKIDSSWSLVSNDNSKFVYAISLTPNQTLTKKQIFDVQSNVQGGIIVNSEMNKADIDYLNTVGKINLNLSAIAVQSGGFVDYSAAWESIK